MCTSATVDETTLKHYHEPKSIVHGRVHSCVVQVYVLGQVHSVYHYSPVEKCSPGLHLFFPSPPNGICEWLLGRAWHIESTQGSSWFFSSMTPPPQVLQENCPLEEGLHFDHHTENKGVPSHDTTSQHQFQPCLSESINHTTPEVLTNLSYQLA